MGTLDEVRMRLRSNWQNISIKKQIFFVTVKLAGFRYTINEEGGPGTKHFKNM
jgi:hypothetical protein